MSVDYEWCCEIVDEYEDIVDCMHSDTLTGAMEYRTRATDSDEPYTYQICLVRTADNGDRAWAYLNDDGLLPACFADACGYDTTKVPQRFHRETERMVTR